MAVAGYRIRIDGGTPIDVGNVLTYPVTGLTPDTLYTFEVQAYDGQGNYSGWSNLVSETTGGAGLFDGFSTTHLGIWSLRQELSAYGGAACQVMIGATPTDVSFANVDTVAANDYVIIQFYDQSGNGYHLAVTEGAPTLSIADGVAVVDCTDGSTMRVSGFTDWQGLADVNMILSAAIPSSTTGHAFIDGAGTVEAYVEGDVFGAGGNIYWKISGSNRFTYTNKPGHVRHYMFDGGGATNALKARFFINNSELTAISTAAQPTTWPSVTHLDINGTPLAGISFNAQFRSIAYVGYELTGPERASIVTGFGVQWDTGEAELICEGDSLTANSANGGSGSANSYPNLLKGLLQTETSITWNATNQGAPAELIGTEIWNSREAQVASLNYHWRPYDIKVIWGGTNDLGSGGGGAGAVTAVLDDVEAYLNYVVARGIDPANIYFLNMLPRQDVGLPNPTFEADRISFNSQLATYLPAGVNLVNVAGVVAWNPLSGTHYLGDQVHLNDTGNAVIAQAVFDVIQPNL